MPLSVRVTDLSSLELLATIATTGSIGACARHHGLSQPAVSARVRGLEQRLGLRLLDRHARGTTLTTSGQIVLEWARPALDAAAALDLSLDTLTGASPAQLTIAASTTIAEFFLPTWFATLRGRLPGVTVSLLCHNSADAVALVRRGAVELAFAELGHIPDELDHRPVVRDRLVVVVAPDHAWATRQAIAPGDLAAAPLILREPGSATRSVLHNRLEALPTPLRLVPAMEFTSATAIKNAVTTGLGPAVLSELTVLDELSAGTLVEVPVSGLVLHRQLHVCWRRHHRFSTSAGDLLDIATGSGELGSPDGGVRQP
ncbi:LysR family transcriptional regulator [Williamsia sterculiae]|uniref:DNA-binding transcriptional regulator, LysR family n=1 Tax=Williamsia sterculiae TaxID=1344003 RepID=A0A1N7GIT1_9NOCA|nr:LysR family transcriptional regulator [Williamsia sterculiae]SIS12504.1 DNA-binding transcriptional regulator, LysR family [Williamsia sterculiae]